MDTYYPNRSESYSLKHPNISWQLLLLVWLFPTNWSFYLRPQKYFPIMMILWNIFIVVTNGKKLIFKNYTLSNKFHNNVCLMRVRSVVVCANFKSRDHSLFLIGQTFNKLDCNFHKPYMATEFHIYRACDICKRQAMWQVEDISAKYYALP